ncbi:MAG TPA: hypothetical protein VKU00_22255 [Chthonomonadaceae bacterium]|nr:hypothetical protein [Chthonomonadaceae bacterium]
MQNQFLTEESQPQYQPPLVTPSEENATEETLERQEEQSVAEFIENMKKRARRYKISLGVNLSIVLLASCLPILQMVVNPKADFHQAAAFCAWGLGGSVVYALGCMLFAGWRGPGRDIRGLAKRAGIRAIGPLIEMRFGFLGPRQFSTLYNTLIELLPEIKHSDVNLLNRKHRDFLYEVLAGTGQTGMSVVQHEKLRLAILEALKQVGDERAVPIVRRLAKVPFWQREPNALQEAAQECLPLLEANLAHVVSTQTLLRASAPETVGADVLLRSANATTEHTPEQLLRASDTTSLNRR